MPTTPSATRPDHALAGVAAVLALTTFGGQARAQVDPILYSMTPWAVVTAPSPGEFDRLGSVMAFNGKVLAATTRGPSGPALLVFRRSGQDVIPESVDPLPAGFEPWEIAASEDRNTIVVADRGDGAADPGSVLIYEYDADAPVTWALAQTLLPPPDAPVDGLVQRFGQSVAVEGDLIAVGADRRSAPPCAAGTEALTGWVYLYEREAPGSAWVHAGDIDPLAGSACAPDDAGTALLGFGAALDLDGDRLAVAQADDSYPGELRGVRVFTLAGDPPTATPESERVGLDPRVNGGARSVQLEGDRAALGNQGTDPANTRTDAANAGSVSVYRRDDAGWAPVSTVRFEDAHDGAPPAVPSHFASRFKMIGGNLFVTTASSSGTAGLYMFVERLGGAARWGQYRDPASLVPFAATPRPTDADDPVDERRCVDGDSRWLAVADPWATVGPHEQAGLVLIYAMELRDCPADLNVTNTMDEGDIAMFVHLFLDADPGADMTGDGRLTLDDVDAFVESYNAGCRRG